MGRRWCVPVAVTGAAAPGSRIGFGIGSTAMQRRFTFTLRIGLVALALTACGGGPEPLSEAESTFCVRNVSPVQMSAVGDEMGVDIAGAFDAAERAVGKALDDGLEGSAVLDAAQEAMETHPGYIEVCRSMYADR